MGFAGEIKGGEECDAVGIVDEAQRRYRPQLPISPEGGGEIGPSAALLLLEDGQTSSRRRAWHPAPFRHHDMQRSSVTGH
jgi:hypothetical protein